MQRSFSAHLSCHKSVWGHPTPASLTVPSLRCKNTFQHQKISGQFSSANNSQTAQWGSETISADENDSDLFQHHQLWVPVRAETRKDTHSCLIVTMDYYSIRNIRNKNYLHTPQGLWEYLDCVWMHRCFTFRPTLLFAAASTVRKERGGANQTENWIFNSRKGPTDYREDCLLI